MNRSRTLAFLGIGATLLFLAQRAGGKILDNLSITKIGGKVRQVMIDRVLVDLTLTLENKTPASVAFDGFVGFLVYGNTVLSNVTISDKFTIPPNGTVDIPALATVVYTQLASNIVSLIVKGNFLNSLRLSGVITTNGVRVNINKNIISVG